MSVQNKFILIGCSVLIFGTVVFTLFLDDKTISFRNSSNAQPSVQNPAVDFTKQQLSVLPGCFSSQYEFDLDQNSTIYKVFQAARENTPDGWEFNGVCSDQSLDTSFIITTSKIVDRKADIPSETFAYTQELFPKLFVPPYTDDGYYRLYRFYIFSIYPTIISYNDVSHAVRSNELQLIGKEIVWYEGLAGCGIEPGSFFKTGKITIACGGGDNGCYVHERVQFDLFGGGTAYLGRCEKNCDLESNQSAELKCE